MRELLKLTVVLTIICSAAATSLALVYNLTKDPIAYQRRLKKLNAIKAVQPDYDNEPDQDFVDLPMDKDNETPTRFYITKKKGGVTGVAFTVSGAGYGGIIELMLGLTPEGTIAGVTILKHTETPGLGAKITEARFMEQFASKNLDNINWALKKDGGEIDQITGATISPQAVVKALHQGLVFFAGHKDEILNAG